MIRKKEDILEVIVPVLGVFVKEEVNKKFTDKQILDEIKNKLLNDVEFLAQMVDVMEAHHELFKCVYGQAKERGDKK